MAWTCPKLDAETWNMVGWIISYCIASSSMTILNKAAIKAFDFPYWLCTFQNLATLLVLAIIVNIVPKNHKIFGLRVQYSNQVVFTWTPAALMFCLMLVSAMSAMQTMSVTTVLVTRSLTPLVTLVLEARVLSTLAARRPSRHPPQSCALLSHAAPFPRFWLLLPWRAEILTGTRAPIADVSASVKIWLSLFTILIGSVFYCLAEIEGTTVGYIWLGVGHTPNVSNQLP